MSTCAAPLTVPTTRFEVALDGSITGDDGAGGRLAAALRYACRIGGEAGYVLGLGDLERLTGRGGATVVARVGWTAAREVTVLAEAELGRPHALRAVVEPRRVDDGAALARSTERLHGLGVHWSAVLTAGRTIVGATALPTHAPGTPSTTTLLEVGLRGAAVLDALDALDTRARDTWVVLDFEGGALLLAAVGDHVLLAAADRLDLPEVGAVVAETAALLGPVDLTPVVPALVTPLPCAAEPVAVRRVPAGAHASRGRGLRRSPASGRPGRRRRG